MRVLVSAIHGDTLGNSGTTLGELLASFDVIDRIDAVRSHLVLTRGRFRPGESPDSGF